MKVWVDADLCQASGYCARTTPEVFEQDADGIVAVRLSSAGPSRSQDSAEAVPAAHEARVRLAAHECPAGAINVTDT